MFDRMQYIFDKPVTIKFLRSSESAIKDFNGVRLGRIVSEWTALGGSSRFEDNHGVAVGSIGPGLGVYGPMNDLRMKIKAPSLSYRGFNRNKEGYSLDTYPPFKLEDLSGNVLASTDTFSTIRSMSQIDSIRSKQGGFNVLAPDRSVAATVRGAVSSNGIQIDIFSKIEQLGLLSLIWCLL
jgi:hypothetical protein